MSVYVMSDIHGLSERFYDMLQTIQFNQSDHLYILGDVIDRGEDGIPLLQYISEQDNMTLLMGNHEYMMLQYYEEANKRLPDVHVMERWHRNGCEPTKEAFAKLSQIKQQNLLQYLKKLPLAISDVC